MSLPGHSLGAYRRICLNLEDHSCGKTELRSNNWLLGEISFSVLYIIRFLFLS